MNNVTRARLSTLLLLAAAGVPVAVPRPRDPNFPGADTDDLGDSFKLAVEALTKKHKEMQEHAEACRLADQLQTKARRDREQARLALKRSADLKREADQLAADLANVNYSTKSPG